MQQFMKSDLLKLTLKHFEEIEGSGSRLDESEVEVRFAK
jgi:hypothetical protein